MKIKTLLMSATAMLSLVFGAAAQNTKKNPLIPAGSLQATPRIVQTGTHPTLSWQIFHPSNISDIAVVNSYGEIILKEGSYVSVSVIGTGITSNHQSIDNKDIYSEIRISSGGAYERFFFARNEDITPQYSSYIKKHNQNTSISFGARFVNEGSWTPFYTNKSANHQVITLTDGQKMPVPQEKIASFLKPYVDSTNTVNVGPMSALVLFELGTTNHANSNFDYQDAAILVNLSNKHQNNGHGNNLDGVDSSNPSNGSGGPNGTVDPSGGVDDEK